MVVVHRKGRLSRNVDALLHSPSVTCADGKCFDGGYLGGGGRSLGESDFSDEDSLTCSFDDMTEEEQDWFL